MWRRFFIVCVFLVFFFAFYLFVDQQSSPVIERKSYGIIEHKINAPHFPAYQGCDWQWKNFSDMGIWVQNCSIKGKKLSVDSVDDGSSLFYSIGGKQDTLALELFDQFDSSYSEEEVLDATYIKLIKSGFLKLESLCNFETQSVNNIKIHRLISKDKKSPCGDYGADTFKETFFIIKKSEGSKRVFFINQMQKKLFDVQSLHIYE